MSILFENLNISEIDIRYRVPLVGCYNPAIYVCPNCGKDVFKDDLKPSKYVCGFAEAPIGTVMITECPECHEKYYSHVDKYSYESFLDAVEDGDNIFFIKKQK